MNNAEQIQVQIKVLKDRLNELWEAKARVDMKDHWDADDRAFSFSVMNEISRINKLLKELGEEV